MLSAVRVSSGTTHAREPLFLPITWLTFLVVKVPFPLHCVRWCVYPSFWQSWCVWHVDPGGCVDVSEFFLWLPFPRRPPTVSDGSIWCRRFSTEPNSKQKQRSTSPDFSACRGLRRSWCMRVQETWCPYPDQVNLDFVPIRILAQKTVLFARTFHDRQWSKDSKARTHSCRPSFICPSHGVNALRCSPLCCARKENAPHRTSVVYIFPCCLSRFF